jgi:UDP-GlcNAc:undecaprenyl-phosphate/decaprenyl-phosphate GlcNAc-1-phosphate transferase
VVVTVAAAAIALAVTPLAAALARRAGVVDRPGPLKVHPEAVPYLGGVGVAAGLAGAVVAARPALALPLLGALVLGVADDARDVPPRLRLAGQVGVGVVTAALLDVRLATGLGFVAVAVASVVLMNGVNMVDGLDGLAAGVTLVAAVGFAALLHGDGRTLALGLAGAMAGFLWWNRPPARVYLGDGGAYLLGAALAALLAMAWHRHVPASRSVAALALVGFPAGELAFAVVRRARSRLPLFSGDRRHLYDRLATLGWSGTAAAGACVLGQVVLAAIAVAAGHATTAVAAVVVAAAAAAVLATGASVGSLR